MTGIRIGSNISALQASRHLADANNALGRTFERLSSGQRINRASDDAAGLAISSSLRSSARVFTQALRNLDDGQSLLSIAQSTLGELGTVSVRLRELATQAANGTYSLQQRRALNDEATALVTEHNRIIESVSFNGLKLLDRSLTELRIQAGYGTDGSVSFGLASALARTVGNGAFEAEVQIAVGTNALIAAVADWNNDGAMDFIGAILDGGSGSDVRVYLGNGDGTFQTGVTYATGSGSIRGASGDFNGDGLLDFVQASTGDSKINVFLGNGDGTFQSRVSYSVGDEPSAVSVGDLNGDGFLDLVTSDAVGGTASVLLGMGDGSFNSATTYFIGSDVSDPLLGDLNNDGILDLVIGERDDGDGTKVHVLIGKGDGSFQGSISYDSGGTEPTPGLGDLDRDGILDLVAVNNDGTYAVFMGNGDGTFQPRRTYVSGATSGAALSDINGDGLLDLVAQDLGGNSAHYFVGNGDGTFKSSVSFASGAFPVYSFVADFNGDGAQDLLTTTFGSGGVGLFVAKPTSVSSLPFLNLASQQGARDAMAVIDASLERLGSELGAIGAAQSRLQAAHSTLTASRENYLTAAGRIIDADVAQDTGRLVRDQILLQAGAAVLAQANVQPALALKLLEA